MSTQQETKIVFVDVKRENLELKALNCDLCGVELSDTYYKYGWASLSNRSHNFCGNCYNRIKK